MVNIYDDKVDGEKLDYPWYNEVQTKLGAVTDVGAYPAQPARYTIFKVGSMFYARNGVTGKIDYLDADANSLFTNIVSGLADGGKIAVLGDGYGHVTLTDPPNGVMLIGENRQLLQFDSLTVQASNGVSHFKRFVLRDIGVNGQIYFKRGSIITLDNILCVKLKSEGNWNLQAFNPYISGFTDYGLVVTYEAVSGDIPTHHNFFGGEIGYEGAVNAQIVQIDYLGYGNFYGLFCEHVTKGWHFGKGSDMITVEHCNVQITGDDWCIGADDNTSRLHILNNPHLHSPNSTKSVNIACSGSTVCGNRINDVKATTGVAIYIDNLFRAVVEKNIIVPNDLLWSIQMNTGVDRSIIKNNTTPNGISVAQQDNYIKDNYGFNPYGVIATPFNNAAGFERFGLPAGGGAGPTTPNTDYKCINVDCVLDIAGGAGVNVTLKDAGGNTISVLGAPPIHALYVPLQFRVNFGNFSVAPTVVVSGN